MNADVREQVADEIMLMSAAPEISGGKFEMAQLDDCIAAIRKKYGEIPVSEIEQIGAEESFFPPVEEIKAFRESQQPPAKTVKVGPKKDEVQDNRATDGQALQVERQTTEGDDTMRLTFPRLMKSPTYAAASPVRQARHRIILPYVVEEAGKDSGLVTSREYILAEIHKAGEKDLSIGNLYNEVATVAVLVDYYIGDDGKSKAAERKVKKLGAKSCGWLLNQTLLIDGIKTLADFDTVRRAETPPVPAVGKGRGGKQSAGIGKRGKGGSTATTPWEGSNADFIRANLEEGFDGSIPDKAREIVKLGETLGLDLKFGSVRGKIDRELKKRKKSLGSDAGKKSAPAPTAPAVPPLAHSSAPPEAKPPADSVDAEFASPLDLSAVVIPKGPMGRIIRKMVSEIQERRVELAHSEAMVVEYQKAISQTQIQIRLLEADIDAANRLNSKYRE